MGCAFDRNTFRRTDAQSADSVADHIEKVKRGVELDKTASNIVGALSSYMGIFAKAGGVFVPTKLADVYLKLYAENKADSWRWLAARSLWRFVVPNGTACMVNRPAKDHNTKFAFFRSIIELLTHLSAETGDKRFLFFEELCKLLKDDANWRKSGTELFSLLSTARLIAGNGFGSSRTFLEDLEPEFEIPRDNFNSLFSKAFAQTGFFESWEKTGRTVAVALNPNLDAVLQRRLRFILDHPLTWNGADWPAYIDMQAEDLPQEVSVEYLEEEALEPPIDLAELKKLIPAAKEQMDAAKLLVSTEQLLRFVSALESKRFLILTGLAGSGKTKLAQAFARWITPVRLASDIFSPGSKIAAERTTYFVKRSDNLAIEFWNAENEEHATKVTLPREMITEWASTHLAVIGSKHLNQPLENRIAWRHLNRRP